MISRVRPSVIAVDLALQFGSQPFRLMGAEIRFPDIGRPVLEKVGFLRYQGEPCLGEAELVAPGPASDHSL